MLYIIITLFTIAALLGIYLLTYIFQNKNTPKGVAFTHGSFAALALILLILLEIIYQPSLLMPIILFILAALGGLTLIYRDLTGKSIPNWLALGHGLIAILGFGVLIAFVFWGNLL